MSDTKRNSAHILQSVFKARRCIRSHLNPTPLIHSPYLSQISGADVWLKLECWQPTGSFKVRGALNKMGLLSLEQKENGVVTGSAGNHGLGVAFAARAWQITPAMVFVPQTAPKTKVTKMADLGATVQRVGETYEDAHQMAERYARGTGATYISAYDDPDVVAGQGTVALEILDQHPDIHAILVPVGGGGMIAGIAGVLKTALTECRVLGIQPEASPAAVQSLRDGAAIDPYDHEPTIADGLAGGFGRVPFDLAHDLIDEVLLSSEYEMRKAIAVLLNRHQLVIEASGAIAIVPLLRHRADLVGKTVVCVLSGGNIDTALLRDILVEFAD